MSEYDFKAKLWIYETTTAPWFFVTLPKVIATRIKFENANMKRGFNSVRVKVVCGDSVWKTSLFPEKATGSYVLPIKAEIRRNENLTEGKMVALSVTII